MLLLPVAATTHYSVLGTQGNHYLPSTSIAINISRSKIKHCLFTGPEYILANKTKIKTKKFNCDSAWLHQKLKKLNIFYSKKTKQQINRK
jgi:hypothetical protein